MSTPTRWTVAATSGPVPPTLDEALRAGVPAAVPGCVHVDLLAAGLIPDPYLDTNEAALAWMHGVDWQYRAPLALAPADDDERVDLAFDGLDTVATVRLGGAVLGSTANMHRSYRFDVRAQADGAERDLVVDLRSATAYALEERDRLGARPAAYPTPYAFVRKAACSFGWDWGPDLRSAGIWREVRVERWRVARLARVLPLVTVAADGTGRVEVRVDVERSGLGEAGPVEVTAAVRGRRTTLTLAPDEAAGVLVVEVPDAPLWWPVGYGDQPLADLVVELAAAGEARDTWTRRIGFRTVELDTTDDEVGTAFVLRVNGRPIAVQGANWIPADHLVTRVTPARLAALTDRALATNLNLLRVWGGGLYESDDFYAACDERGLLVWQDFALACAAYPEEQPLADEIEAEARENVVLLAPHPSLVVWNGGNENVWGHEDWGWKDELGDLTWGARYVHETFPRVLAELDLTRPYAVNSPFSPRRDPAEVHPNDPDHGTHHQWEVWNRVDWRAYRDEVPRFCSEFGFQAPPTWRTLTDAVHAADGGPLAASPAPRLEPAWASHQKADDGDDKLDRGMAPHLGVPDEFADWHWAAQLNQARALEHAVAHYRSWWPRTAGWIVWQLNDCWPVTSWALVDGADRPKPAWYAVRRAAAPRVLVVVERDGAPALAVVNDTDEPWAGTVAVRRERLDGARLADDEAVVEVPARSVVVVPLARAVAAAADPSDEVLVAELDGVRAVHPFAEDVDTRLDPDALEATAEPEPGGYAVHLRARSLVRGASLLVDRLDPNAEADDAVLDLSAGAMATVHVRAAAGLEPADLVRPPVLRTANDLAARPRQRTVGSSATSSAIVTEVVA
jgi:beta-mannosidase